MSDSLTEYAEALDMPLSGLSTIKRNKYCAIYRATLRDGTACVIKDYGESDPRLAKLEADALTFYDSIGEELPTLKRCRLLAYNEKRNVLAMSFMEGRSYTQLVYRSLFSRKRRARAVAHARTLGMLLHELYERRHTPGGELADFMREYMEYVSGRLARVPAIGRRLLGRGLSDGRTLFEEARRCGEPPSFCHGDYVLRNAHADGEGVGLIDWANTSADSHILNDVYNFRTACHNMFLPPRYRRQLLAAFSEGLGSLHFDIRLHRFFFEYHRRRWLMLKLYARRPWPWLQVLRAVLTFARPFDPARLGPLAAHVRTAP